MPPIVIGSEGEPVTVTTSSKLTAKSSVEPTAYTPAAGAVTFTAAGATPSTRIPAVNGGVNCSRASLPAESRMDPPAREMLVALNVIPLRSSSPATTV